MFAILQVSMYRKTLDENTTISYDESVKLIEHGEF